MLLLLFWDRLQCSNFKSRMQDGDVLAVNLIDGLIQTFGTYRTHSLVQR